MPPDPASHAATDTEWPLAERWDALAEALASYRAVLDGRTVDGSIPGALTERGWTEYLVALADDELAEIEILGQRCEWPGNVPSSLEKLTADARSLCSVPSLEGQPVEPSTRRRLETPRKRAQIDALSSLVLPLARNAARVVDVGSGHGHLARDLSDRISVPVVGLERDPSLTARAKRLPASAGLSFELCDVLRDGLALSAGDLALGLHACGELGDALVVGVADAADSALLVGCCLQKTRSAGRLPLNARRTGSSQVELPRELLGLSNFTAREEGVEASRTENLAARQRRMALHHLLSRVEPLRFGAEMDGLNRRSAHDPLDSMVTRAFELRGKPVPSGETIAEAERWAAMHHALARRLSLPRGMLARVLEVFVLVDRALYLETRGFEVRIGTAFPDTLSARNLALVATRKRDSMVCDG